VKHLPEWINLAVALLFAAAVVCAITTAIVEGITP
jgi:hypothetical protein